MDASFPRPSAISRRRGRNLFAFPSTPSAKDLVTRDATANFCQLNPAEFILSRPPEPTPLPTSCVPPLSAGIIVLANRDIKFSCEKPRFRENRSAGLLAKGGGEEANLNKERFGIRARVLEDCFVWFRDFDSGSLPLWIR